MQNKTAKRVTTPEEEGIELLPDAMERLERAVKAAARHGPRPSKRTVRRAPRKKTAP